MSVSCFCPFILTLTMPPPAEASTSTVSTCFCSPSCICRNCVRICCSAFTSMVYSSPPFHVGNMAAESFQHRAHDRILLELGAQFPRAVGRTSPHRNGLQFNTHAHRLAENATRDV